MQAKENALEKAFRLAADEAAQRPDFYATLLESSVYIFGQGECPGSQAGTIMPGEKLLIEHWVRENGTPVIPFFSSLGALQQATVSACRYMALPARDLFEITRGNMLVLNPQSGLSKEFFPNEIEALLSDGINRLPEQQVLANAAQILFAQPEEYPENMTASLSSLFARRSNVKAAYLVLMQDPGRDEQPHLVVGLEADGDIERLLREAGTVAGDTSPAGEPVGLMQLKRGDGNVSDYLLREIKPFYERRWGGRLKALLGAGAA
jgi:hypothetical protein